MILHPDRGSADTRAVGLYRDQGVVLRTIRLGEADRIVTLLTERHGKVRAVAKGVRKTKSRIGGRLEPLVHVSVMLYERRQASSLRDGASQLDVITQVEAIENFRDVREDLDRLAKATALLEASDQVAQERHANARLYQMLLGALRALTAHDSPLLVPAFFLKLLSMEGSHPMLDGCASCGEESPAALTAFEIGQGGLLCRVCAHRGAVVAVAISTEALALVRRVLGGDLIGALNHPGDAAANEVGILATRAMEYHLERRLRAIHVLDRS